VSVCLANSRKILHAMVVVESGSLSSGYGLDCSDSFERLREKGREREGGRRDADDSWAFRAGGKSGEVWRVSRRWTSRLGEEGTCIK